MSEKKVPLVVGEIYHVFNRGVDKREIFIDKFDYVRFYESLALFNTLEPAVNFRLAKGNRHKGAKKLVEVHAYSLLPNHYHLLLKQVSSNGVSEFMKRLGTGYTSYFNERNSRSGSLFQGKFKRVHIEDQNQFGYVFAYVNENHFVHNINFKREICHSSSLYYQGKSKSKVVIGTGISSRYSFADSKKLAKDIYNKRKNLTSNYLLE